MAIKLFSVHQDKEGVNASGHHQGRQTRTSSPHDDGFLWLKYEQKCISQAQFPRCYHRDSNCGATKQVQHQQYSSGDPLQYVVMYFNEHTCETMAILGMPALDDLSVLAPARCWTNAASRRSTSAVSSSRRSPACWGASSSLLKAAEPPPPPPGVDAPSGEMPRSIDDVAAPLDLNIADYDMADVAWMDDVMDYDVTDGGSFFLDLAHDENFQF